ncbi:MAG: response regulator [Proteobacteria bacterium]|nr:response regulator [Pseudomonadota bacterium]MBU2262251.1 response regulator [Pseudomonadota bacterium]
MNRIKLLIVDDEIVVQRSCVDIFTEKRSKYDIKYDVRTVSSADEALRLLETESFDIVLTDLKMPGLPGIELIVKIKNKHPETAIIVITGFSTVHTAVEAMKLGATDFIPKPFTPDEILSAVENAAVKMKGWDS